VVDNRNTVWYSNSRVKRQCIWIFIWLTLAAVSVAGVKAMNSPTVEKKVYLLDLNPWIDSQGMGIRQMMGWNDIYSLTDQFTTDLRNASGGYLNYRVVKMFGNADAWLQKTDGFYYTDQSYLDVVQGRTIPHSPDYINYQKFISDFGLCELRNSDRIDEVWVWGGPWFGFYESAMAGPDSYWINSSPISGTTCQKPLIIMAFNYQRPTGEMLEAFSHRTESTLDYYLGSNSDWPVFHTYDYQSPGRAACGTVHYAPNGVKVYDWNNSRYVNSSCDDWTRYPYLTGATQNINCSPWNCSQYDYMKYWLGHLPKAAGMKGDKWNNWWRYTASGAAANKCRQTSQSACGSQGGVCGWIACDNGEAGCFESGTLSSSVCPVIAATPTPTATRKPGDANQDEKVDGVDYSIWLRYYDGAGGWGQGDFNWDGRIDGVDYSIWLINYGK
jgi:hypothetical protein